MKKIKIEINQAKILSFDVSLEDKYPEVSATIGLFSGKKQISTFNLRTDHDFGNNVIFKLPFNLIPPIKEIAKELETVLVQKCSQSMGELMAPKK